MNHKKSLAPVLMTGWLALFAGGASALAADEGVKLTAQEDRVRIEIAGDLFTEYVFKGANHVYYYPVLGPGGLAMTRNYPMRPDVPDEARDHPHQRSLWFSHGAVNGIDFWAEAAKSGKIVHDKFLEVKSGPAEGVIRAQNRWVAPDGKVTLTDETVFRVYARPNTERLFDFEITLKAPEGGDVVLGDTKEGTMGIRVAESMRLLRPKPLKSEGHIVLSTGVRDDKATSATQTWGKRAAWCDYYGPVNGKTVGIAIFDHPSNPVHPTYWHVRDYGLFAANPFGIHDFTKQPAGTGNLTIPAGKSITFKYRFYLHEGDEQQAKVADRYAEWTKK
jgi:hypothetical protein